jgi:hypothetical protein
MLKDYTIVRHRVVHEFMSTEVRAKTQKEALAKLNADTDERYEDGNEWCQGGDYPRYINSKPKDVLEFEEVDEDPRETW